MNTELKIIYEQADEIASKLIMLEPSVEFFELLDIFNAQFNQLMQIVATMNSDIEIDIVPLKGKLKIIEDKLLVEFERVKAERDSAVAKKNSNIGSYGLSGVIKSSKIDSVS